MLTAVAPTAVFFVVQAFVGGVFVLSRVVAIVTSLPCQGQGYVLVEGYQTSIDVGRQVKKGVIPGGCFRYRAGGVNVR